MGFPMPAPVVGQRQLPHLPDPGKRSHDRVARREQGDLRPVGEPSALEEVAHHREVARADAKLQKDNRDVDRHTPVVHPAA